MVAMGDRTTRPGDSAEMSVRELMAALAVVEEQLRQAPLLVTLGGTTAVNPEVAPLLRRQRQLVARLRARRTSWVRFGSGEARQPSAAWPPPPWAG
ncbi:hypothetical protein ASC58_15840 [Phycicoccus sp. Root101]|nr:hypothetical protein ASC58_15840 [Phycicoccus sp. Root101]